MTKTELMETYTAEQLADRYLRLQERFNRYTEIVKEIVDKLPEELKEGTEFHLEISRLQSEVEKYRKAFEDAKKEHDCQVMEYRNKVEKLGNHHKFSMMQIDDVLMEFLGVTHEIMDKPHDFEVILQELIDKNKTELERAKTTINHIDDILEKLFGARHDTFEKPDEFEKILKQKAESYNEIADYLCDEPISVAQTLISEKRGYKLSEEEKQRSGLEKGYYHIFDISELRQIAEHLLVYCNHNGEVEE